MKEEQLADENRTQISEVLRIGPIYDSPLKQLIPGDDSTRLWVRELYKTWLSELKTLAQRTPFPPRSHVELELIHDSTVTNEITEKPTGRICVSRNVSAKALFDYLLKNGARCNLKSLEITGEYQKLKFISKQRWRKIFPGLPMCPTQFYQYNKSAHVNVIHLSYLALLSHHQVLKEHLILGDNAWVAEDTTAKTNQLCIYITDPPVNTNNTRINYRLINDTLFIPAHFDQESLEVEKFVEEVAKLVPHLYRPRVLLPPPPPQ